MWRYQRKGGIVVKQIKQVSITAAKKKGVHE